MDAQERQRVNEVLSEIQGVEKSIKGLNKQLNALSKRKGRLDKKLSNLLVTVTPTQVIDVKKKSTKKPKGQDEIAAILKSMDPVKRAMFNELLRKGRLRK